jgi:beta-lactamase class D OXA-50
MKRTSAVLIALAVSLHSLPARTYREVAELEKFFKEQGVAGTFVLFDVATDTMLVSNEARAKTRFTPASTFKIANSLIGLDVGAVKDVDEVLPYGGKPQRIKAWEHDMSLREAIKVSNVAIYQELARRIGLERMRAGVKKLNYGNMEIGNVVDRFWLNGPLAISAVEQTEFLSRLVAGKLPVSAEAVRAVKEITLLEKTESYELHAKTGWLVNPKQQLGWWVGWVERENKFYSFALNVDMAQDEDAAKRIPIGRECLKALGKL